MKSPRVHPAGVLILGSAAITEAIQMSDYTEAVERGFRALAEGGAEVPEVVHLHANQGAFHVKSAGLATGRAYVAVKVNGNFPENRRLRGLPTIQGVITLCDGVNGAPLAILDSNEVTAQRTAAATAVAARYLARPDSSVATIVGCGVQGRVQLQALLDELPLKQVYAIDLDAEVSGRFAVEMSRITGSLVTPVATLEEATPHSDVIVTCTSSRVPFLRTAHVRPGTFVAAVGADNDDKQELDPELLAQSTVVVDVLAQCIEIGELHHALKARVMGPADIAGELGEIVAGRVAGRRFAEETIIFDSTGTAVQDVAAAAVIYERAVQRGLGHYVELGPSAAPTGS